MAGSGRSLARESRKDRQWQSDPSQAGAAGSSGQEVPWTSSWGLHDDDVATTVSSPTGVVAQHLQPGGPAGNGRSGKLE
jgi:hypothetical protein